MKSKTTVTALAVTLLGLLPAVASLADPASTAGTAAAVNYASLFDTANITANLPALGGYVAGTALAFGGLSLTVRWIQKFMGH